MAQYDLLAEETFEDGTTEPDIHILQFETDELLLLMSVLDFVNVYKPVEHEKFRDIMDALYASNLEVDNYDKVKFILRTESGAQVDISKDIEIQIVEGEA